MKILVCTDGSEHSQKALKKASEVAERCTVDELAIIHICEGKFHLPHHEVSGGKGYAVTDADMQYMKDQYMMQKDKGERILKQALKVFEDKNITARTIMKEGSPAHTIKDVAAGEGFDMIFIGSRGLGGLKRVILGSVSNAVVQEVENCSIVIVK